MKLLLILALGASKSFAAAIPSSVAVAPVATCPQGYVPASAYSPVTSVKTTASVETTTVAAATTNVTGSTSKAASSTTACTATTAAVTKVTAVNTTKATSSASTLSGSVASTTSGFSTATIGGSSASTLSSSTASIVSSASAISSSTATTSAASSTFSSSVSASSSSAASSDSASTATATPDVTSSTATTATTTFTTTTAATTSLAVPAAPSGLGYVDTAPVASALLPMVDYISTNIRTDPCYANATTNAGVRVLIGHLDMWTPSTEIVDAGVTLAGTTYCPAVVASNWTGIPGDSTDGHVANKDAHSNNIQLSIQFTQERTDAQALQAYLDDRRNKAYSMVDSMGPLTSAWLNLTQQTTTITSMPADATTVLYSDGGSNLGVVGSANTLFGLVTSLLSAMGNNGSTEPAKRFFKYARPWRWSSDVVVVPALVPAESSTPATDGGFPSGHTAEAHRNAVAMAFAVPQRFQEIYARAAELGFSRILAGMHSPMDVMGGARHGIAIAAANLYAAAAAGTAAPAYAQAQAALAAAVNASLYEFAHSASLADDRFADRVANKALYKYRLTYGFDQIRASGATAVVPKGAEVLLLTRLPYLTSDQIRVVLKTTAIDSGYVALDDEEGWGRLNLFDAADGYGRFDGDVTVTMDASLGGFNAADSWNNDISGAGLLTKLGSGALTLTGANSFTGGVVVSEGTLIGASSTAFGSGPVYVSGGTIVIDASVEVSSFTQLSSTLQINVDAGVLTVDGLAYIGADAVLVLNFSAAPVAGSSVVVISCTDVYGTFSTVEFTGAVSSATVSYTANGVLVSF